MTTVYLQVYTVTQPILITIFAKFVLSSTTRKKCHSIPVIERCLEDVQQWMVVNKLKLNGDKTELFFLTARHRHPPPLDSILIGVDITKASKNIGVWLVSVLSMDVQLKKKMVNLPFSIFVT